VLGEIILPLSAEKEVSNSNIKALDDNFQP
jgi:hypothetical protein